MTPLIGLLILLLAAGAPPEGDVDLEIDLAQYPVRGQVSAPVLVVEFSDFKCHACEKFNLTIMPNLTKEFIRSGMVKVAFVDFPLVDQAHYTTVAESAHCAGRQGKYWEMHDSLWEHVGALSDDNLVAYAAELRLDVPAFKKCLEADEYRARVLNDLGFAHRLGVSSRPTFFIGRRQAEGSYRGRYVVGAHNYVVFKSVITRMLPQGGAR